MLPVGAVDRPRTSGRRRAHPGVPERHRAQVRHRSAHPVQYPRPLGGLGLLDDTWTVTAEQDGSEKTYRGRFLFFGSGYYNYDEGYTPDFPGLHEFDGSIVHPQHWPEDLDYQGKKVVVIGSGATAMSLIPSLAETASKVTMLQRSPTYLFSAAKISGPMNLLRKMLPRRISHSIVRQSNALLEGLIWFLARKTPGFVKWWIRQIAVRYLPEGYDVDTHFKPRYNPWDQRLCLIPDADLYVAIGDGRAEVVTDNIDHFDSTGIALKSGEHLDADIIVTATGLQLQALGGVAVSLDGAEIKPQDRFVYKAHMLEEVPNLFWCVGYTNASWTLRADMTARATAKLLAHMKSHGYTHAYPHLAGEPMPEKSAWDIQAGYVLRAPHALPKSGIKRPWNVRQNYYADAIDYRFDRITEAMVFGRADQKTALPDNAVAAAHLTAHCYHERKRYSPSDRAGCRSGIGCSQCFSSRSRARSDMGSGWGSARPHLRNPAGPKR